MRQLRAWMVRLGGFVGELFHKDKRDREMAEEMESHLQMHIEENIERGMSPEEARRDALIQSGGVESAKESYRDQRGIRWLETLIQDVRFALRMLRKNPGFTIVAALTLALGIGANTAMFSVINAVVLRPLPYPEPDRIVELMRSLPGRNLDDASIPKFMIWRKQTQVFQNVAAFDGGYSGINLMGGDRPEQLKGIHVSMGYFAVFGAPVAMGRTFSEEEDRPGGAHVVVISNGLWRSRFGGNPDVIGQAINLEDEPYQVIGVLGPRFTPDSPSSLGFLLQPELWLPLQADPNSIDETGPLFAAARLKTGVTLAKAQAAMKFTFEEFHRKFPKADTAPHESFTAIPLRDLSVGDFQPALLVLLGAVVFVLLIACANMANLLLMRATLRRREIAIRAALGAGRRRLIFQLLTESILLSLAGGMLGLVIGYSGVRSLLATNPDIRISRIGEHGSAITLDWRVLLFTLFISVLTGVLFGLIPAFNASRTDLISTLNESGARSGTSLRQNKSRAVLVITEVSLAVVLLTGAALLIRTFGALRTLNPGFDMHNVLTMEMALNGARFQKTSSVAQLAREGEQRIRNIPSVEAAGLTCALPLEMNMDMTFLINAHPPTDRPFNGDAMWRDVSPGYFDAFRIPLLRGRLFTDRDESGATPVVLINETMAKQFWPQGDPLGEIITIGDPSELKDSPRQIIGIVADTRNNINRKPDPIMYVAVAQVSDAWTALLNHVVPMTWVVRTKVAPYSLSADIQRELRAASDGLPVAHIRSMDQVVVESTARNEFNMTLLSIFAGVALLLAAIGIYGLMAYSVQQRTQEIGIRMALGAQQGDVLGMVLRDGLLLCLIGIVIGIAGAFATTRLLKSLIFEVSPTDPVTFVSVVVLLAGVALVACYIPARRATRVDPMVALRHE